MLGGLVVAAVLALFLDSGIGVVEVTGLALTVVVLSLTDVVVSITSTVVELAVLARVVISSAKGAAVLDRCGSSEDVVELVGLTVLVVTTVVLSVVIVLALTADVVSGESEVVELVILALVVIFSAKGATVLDRFGFLGGVVEIVGLVVLVVLCVVVELVVLARIVISSAKGATVLDSCGSSEVA